MGLLTWVFRMGKEAYRLLLWDLKLFFIQTKKQTLAGVTHYWCSCVSSKVKPFVSSVGEQIRMVLHKAQGSLAGPQMRHVVAPVFPIAQL